jgi:hypothetical protein
MIVRLLGKVWQPADVHEYCPGATVDYVQRVLNSLVHPMRRSPATALGG